jgi:FKBP-type peptidyl-prolyl cis-trans isomerase
MLGCIEFLPRDIAYGVNGAPPRVPPDADLVFEVELLNIERRDEL